jgi:deoxyribose-phosphate aldolase
MDDVPAHIEHTVLGPTTGPDDVAAACRVAADLGMRACVPPAYLPVASATAPTVPLTTVVDFPHGQGATGAVVAAAERAVADGAAEVDVVAPVGRFLGGDPGAARTHLDAVCGAVDAPVKVILETPLVTDDDRDDLAALAADAGADYLKTATGFSDGGATTDDVAAMAEHAPVKASGGIGSWADAEAMFDAGAHRIGASSGDVIVREWRAQS